MFANVPVCSRGTVAGLASPCWPEGRAFGPVFANPAPYFLTSAVTWLLSPAGLKFALVVIGVMLSLRPLRWYCRAGPDTGSADAIGPLADLAPGRAADGTPDAPVLTGGPLRPTAS